MHISSLPMQGSLSNTVLIKQIEWSAGGNNGKLFTSEAKPGPKSLVAKFMPRQREFLDARRDNGIGSINLFRTEVFIYDSEICTQLGMPQPMAFFEAHDLERDVFTVIMEDLYSLGLDSGEQMSELSGHITSGSLNLLPHLGLYSEQIRIMAGFNGARYNSTTTDWEDNHGRTHNLGTTFQGFDSPAYTDLMDRQLKGYFSVEDDRDTAYLNLGFKQLCHVFDLHHGDSANDKVYSLAFERTVESLQKNKEMLQTASCSIEEGGWLDCGIAHGDCRIDNIWYPRPLASTKRAPPVIPSLSMTHTTKN